MRSRVPCRRVTTVVEAAAGRTPAGASPSPRSAPRSDATIGSVGATIADAVSAATAEALRIAESVAGPSPGTIGQALARDVGEAAGGAVAAGTSALEALGRSLLGPPTLTPIESVLDATLAAARSAEAAKAAPGASPGANGQTPTAATNGTTPQSAPPEPAELAWLVNEALIEQARRHGMDLS